MSQRSISENLQYIVDNEGLNYTAPDITLVATTAGELTGTWTVNSNPIVGGTVTGSNSVAVGASPSRIVDLYYPKVKFTTLSVNLVANTPLDIDWTAKTDTQDSFPALPTPGAASSFIQLRPGTPQHWEFPVGGYWLIHIFAVPTVVVSDTNTLKLQILNTFNSGVAFTPLQTQILTKGGAGTPSVDHIGGCACFHFADPSSAVGVERIKFNMTCTENKTVDLRLGWCLLGRD